MITISKTGVPAGVFQAKQKAEAEATDQYIKVVLPHDRKGETDEERKVRKQETKDAKRLRRDQKRDLKE